MKYLKPPLSFGEQADLLIRRGLIGDRDRIIERLEAVNYYRLSAYWYTFGILTVLHYLLKQTAPQSHWRQRLTALFAEYNDIPLRFMGFPDNWETSPLWQ